MGFSWAWWPRTSSSGPLTSNSLTRRSVEFGQTRGEGLVGFFVSDEERDAVEYDTRFEGCRLQAELYERAWKQVGEAGVCPALLGVHFTAVVIELFMCFVAKVFGATMSEDMVAPLQV